MLFNVFAKYLGFLKQWTRPVNKQTLLYPNAIGDNRVCCILAAGSGAQASIHPNTGNEEKIV
jgi:hypothetical protein